MDIEKLIDGLKNSKGPDNCHDCALGYWALMGATALSTLQAENEKLREKIEDARLEGYAKGLGEMSEENERLWAELEQVKAELNAAQSPEVLEAVDELMEFARTRMSTADWLYYVDVLGEWRGQKED